MHLSLKKVKICHFRAIFRVYLQIYMQYFKQCFFYTLELHQNQYLAYMYIYI